MPEITINYASRDPTTTLTHGLPCPWAAGTKKHPHSDTVTH